jgi:hypothetical protein
MSRLDELDDTTRHLINRHADELTTTATTSLAFHSQTPSKIQFKRHNTPAALFHFISRSIGHYIFALLTAPQTIFYDPVGASFAIVALPVINIALLFTQLIFAIGGLLGLGHAGHWFSQTYGFGMSAVNMLQPHLFDDKEVLQAHIAARSALADRMSYQRDGRCLADVVQPTAFRRTMSLSNSRRTRMACLSRPVFSTWMSQSHSFSSAHSFTNATTSSSRRRRN